MDDPHIATARELPADGRQEELETLKDKISGAILGVFIGDALGVGVHWQYDLDKLEADRGFVTDYLDPLPGTYHSGTPDAPGRGKLTAGQLEQQGAIDKLLLESLAEHGELNQEDFLERFESVILKDPTMDGTRQGGRYGWTDKSICEFYQCRITEQRPWSECIPPRSDTPDSIVRAALIAALYFKTPHEMAMQVQIHAKAATKDSSVQAHSVAFASMIGAALQDVPLDQRMRNFLYQQPGHSLPFSSLLSSTDFEPGYGHYTEPDSLLWFGSIAQGVSFFNDTIQPAHRGVLLYGQFCAFFGSVPSAYYCALRFPDDFEDAVLCSLNGGGQNTMRTSLTGALLGARVGLSNIPTRFLEGLEDSKRLLDLAHQVAEIAISRKSDNDTWYWPSNSEVGFTIGAPAHHGTTSSGPSTSTMLQSHIATSRDGPTDQLLSLPMPVLLLAFVGLALVLASLRQFLKKKSPSRYEALP